MLGTIFDIIFSPWNIINNEWMLNENHVNASMNSV